MDNDNPIIKLNQIGNESLIDLDKSNSSLVLEELSSQEQLEEESSSTHKYNNDIQTNLQKPIERRFNLLSLLKQIFFTWTKELYSLSKNNELELKKLTNTGDNPYNPLINKNSLERPYERLSNNYFNKASKTYHSLLFSILKTNFFDEIIVLSLSLFITFLGIFRLNITRDFMNIFSTHNYNSITKISAIFLLIRLCQVIFFHYNENLCEKLCNNTRSQLLNLIYSKLLKTSIFTKKYFDNGKLNNFIQRDIESINFLFYYAPMTLVVPFQLIINILMLFKIFGRNYIFSFITFIVFLCLAYFIEYFYVRTKRQFFINSDDRLKTTTSVLQNIKLIKMFTYEPLFYKIIKSKRQKETNNFKKIESVFVLSNFIHWFIPLICSIVTIGFQAIKEGSLKIEDAIIAIEIYDSISYPLYRIPIFISSFINTLLSMTRMEEFLNEEDIDKNILQEEDHKKKLFKNDEENDYAIIIENTDFGIKNFNKTNENLLLLKNINMKIRKGKLIGILGETGSGKTNLANSIIHYYDILNKEENDEDNKKISNFNPLKFRNIKSPVKIHKSSHNILEFTDNNLKQNNKQRMIINGKVSIATQIPFIINDTFINNVKFFNKLDRDKFEDVILYSQLADDITNLEAKEYHEILMGGSNLSGGQKARLSLARAIYNKADIYLFDDPIASVDPIIYNKIYENVLKKYLKDKTRIIFQHDLSFIEHMDYIYYLNQGKIVFSGTPHDFKNTDYYSKMKKSNNKLFDNDSNEKLDSIQNLGYKNKNKLNSNLLMSCRKQSFESISKVNKRKFIEIGKTIKDEALSHQKIKVSSYKGIFYIMGGYSYLIPLLIILFTLLWQILQALNNYWLTQWSNRVSDKKIKNIFIGEKKQNKLMLYDFFIYCLLGAFSLLFLFIKEFLLTRANLNIFKLLHNNMIKRIIKAPINLFHDIVPIGRIVNVLNSDLDRCKLVVKYYGFLIRGLASLLTSAAICWFYNKYSVILLPILIIFCYLIVIKSIQCNRDMNRVECLAKSPLFNTYNETINGIINIRAYNSEEQFLKKFNINIYDYFLISIYKNGANDRFLLYLDLCAFFYLFFIVFYLNFDYNLQSAGSLGLLLKYSLMFCDQLCFFYKQVGFIQNEMVHYERCEEYCNILQEHYSPIVPHNQNNINNINYDLVKTNDKFKIIEPTIRFEKYYAKYRETTLRILRNINLTINKNEKIGIVGRSGSGKSSLINALFRIFEPDGGKIFISDKEITSISLKELRKQICIVPQEPFLFDGTLRFNMDALNEYKNHEIINSLNKVGISLSLDFPIRENGKNLSLGEKQLICFARAILQKKKIVIFDEATANCDESTESKIIDCINNEFKDSTVLIIAHKLANIKGCNKILVIDNGKIREYDEPSILYANPNSLFRELCDNEEKFNKNV